MVDKFSQVASNIPAANADTNKQYLVINGYPVVFSFSNEPNPEAFERIRDILLAIRSVSVIPVTESSVSRPAAPGRRVIRYIFWMRSLISQSVRSFPK